MAEKAAAAKRAWSERNREKLKASRRAWRKRHPEKVRAWNRAASARKHRAAREKMFAILGSRCCRCGFADKRALEVDHVDGGGRRLGHHKNRARLLRAVREHPELFQVLCANCNRIKQRDTAAEHGGRLQLTA